MQGQYLIIGSAVVIALVIVIIILHFIKQFEMKYYRDKIKELEKQRNIVASTPVLLELSKVEPIIKNDKMEEKYNKWHDEFISLKENRLTLIDDMLIDLDIYVDKRDYKSCSYSMAKIEMEIYKVREAADNLLEEIKDITLSEEKYRAIVTKLKTKYRVLNKEFQDHKQLYEQMQEPITLQLENIERRFLDFEKVMEDNDYAEVVHVVKALDTMIEHIDIIVKEVPDVLLMANQIIPKRLKEVKDNYDELVSQGYPLDYLNIDYNLDEIKKNIDGILDKVNVLNLEGCMFDLKTMLEYLDSLFIDFEKERLARKVYEEVESDFSKKIEKTNKLVNDVYLQLDDIKNLYDLNDEDVDIIHKVNKSLVVINDDYKKLIAKVTANSTPYTMLNKEIEDLTVRLKNMEEELDKSLKSLGNMYDDEVRAREQLNEIQEFLKQCKYRMRTYKLPVITDNYFVQLSEANEAIYEVIKELEKKPIVIKTLNTRVDTARDLVLKLYNTTNEMIRMAQCAEIAIVYGNRYRDYEEVDAGLNDARDKFFMGDYKKSLDIAIRTISLIDNDISKKLFNSEGY
ncbi:MAG: septation ring formation regulator EzrA [Bacilli bacterium]|nr:septation ring formation regulator EzrA [Mycoplasmatota bacterium]MDD6263628.1 septation ring formation regulator EzrA [bacterium]MDD6941911.1 septation ring formation regulator EzrA [bacterium]MDY2696896.1 septation ring formation regulator EzrA [Bacilli bacterium]MEE0014567.1 septation ring formation regulator EzrA [Bacilli bacterium]